MTTNIFEYATRNKLRFQSEHGWLTVEQLWEVPLRSKDDFNLNKVAKAADASLKEIAEDNFVDNATPEQTRERARREVAFELVKHVIDTKLGEEKAAEKRAANKKEKELLLAALAEKQAGEMGELTVKELKRRIAALDTE